ncbi:MAG: hypothetical protein LBO74_05755, partial [Candidatus Symbiothrix sp.]|nr:hypothetical protein [Candidatus Symbiothrix sp.]
APATPGVIRFTPDLADGVDLQGIVTAEIDAVDDDASYLWSISPAIEGLAIEGPATGTSVTLRASTEGAKDLSSLSVLAHNDCGDSAPQPATGTITVRDCTGAPTGGSITGLTQTVAANASFQMSVTGVSTSGNTTYKWNVPAGLTLDGADDQAAVHFKAAATVSGVEVTCAVTNDCGAHAVTAIASVTVVITCGTGSLKIGDYCYMNRGTMAWGTCDYYGGTRPPCGAKFSASELSALGNIPAPWASNGTALRADGVCTDNHATNMSCFYR